MNMRSLFTFAALSTFGAGLVSAVGLSGCGEPQMYCLAPDGAFAAVFTTVTGDNDCLPASGRIGLDYYLGFQGEGANNIADPSKGRLSFTLVQTRKKMDAALKHQALVKRYEACVNKDASINTNFTDAFKADPFWSIGDFANANPDAEEKCFVQNMSEARLKVPAMPGFPECINADESKVPETPAFAAIDVKYTATKLTMRVSPAFQGLYANGEFNYAGQRGDGSACSGTYRFEAINPVETCTTDAECAKKQQGEDGKSPTILVPGALKCMGYKAAVGQAKEVKGICVLAPKA